MKRLPPAPAVAAGLLAAFVGFTSSFSVILQGLSAVGATQAQAASGLMALSLAMGLCAIIASFGTRMPVSVAWSTPGAALLVGSSLPEGGFPEAVGAFMMAGAFVLASGVWRPLGRLIATIPASLANAMLAGVLFPLCLAPIRAAVEAPAASLAIVGTWLAVAQWKRLLAAPAAAFVAVAIIYAGTPADGAGARHFLPHPVWVLPEFTLASAVGIALPLFLVTMASQNIPGLAVLKVNGYAPSPGPLFSMTGIFTILSAPLGGHTVNLAAMTAALCAGAEAGPDRERRYWSGVVSGVAYIALGLTAGAVTAFASVSPVLIEAVAGLALIAAFSSSLHAAMAAGRERESATVTFLVAASGIAILGIGAAFWGLLAGGLVRIVTRRRVRHAEDAEANIEDDAGSPPPRALDEHTASSSR